MLHNSKYYVKRIPKVVKNNYKIDSFFSQPSASLSTENKNAPEALAPCTTTITTSSLSDTPTVTCDPAPSTCTSSLIDTPTVSCDPAPSCTTTSSLVDTPIVSCDPYSEVSDNHSDTEESDEDECGTEFLTPDQRVFYLCYK